MPSGKRTKKNRVEGKKAAGVHAKPKSKIICIFKQVPWLFVAGSVLIFVSWILQNQFAREWSDDLVSIKWDQMTLDVQQVRRDVWNSAFVADSCSESPSSDFMGKAAYFTIECMLNMSAWSKDRFVEDEGELQIIYWQKNVQKERAKRYLGSNQFDSLIAMRMELIESESKQQKAEKESHEIIQKRNDIQTKAIRANILFVLLFAAGSAFVGTSWVSKTLKALGDGS